MGSEMCIRDSQHWHGRSSYSYGIKTTKNSILLKWRIDFKKEDRFKKETGSVYKLWSGSLDSIPGRKVSFLALKTQTYLNDGGE